MPAAGPGVGIGGTVGGYNPFTPLPDMSNVGVGGRVMAPGQPWPNLSMGAAPQPAAGASPLMQALGGQKAQQAAPFDARNVGGGTPQPAQAQQQPALLQALGGQPKAAQPGRGNYGLGGVWNQNDLYRGATPWA